MDSGHADNDPPDVPRVGGLEIRGTGAGLLDDDLVLRARGGGPGDRLIWRARVRDDDGRVWRAVGTGVDELAGAWKPAKTTTRAWAALQSLRPVELEIRVEADDGRAATRTLTRHLVADGVRIRRWRDMPGTTLHLPATDTPCATVLIDATASAEHVDVATLAAPLLASRGALVLLLAPGKKSSAGDELLSSATERLAAIPNVTEITTLAGDACVLPPGLPAVDGHDVNLRIARWDELLAAFGATSRGRP